MPKADPDLAELWQARIQEWKASGQSKSQWCRDNQLPCHQFFYWFNRLYPTAKSHAKGRFVELHDDTSGNSGIRVECGELFIRLDRDFDEAALLRCIQTLRKAS